MSLVNVGVSFLIAVLGVRELNHRNLLRKLFGLISLFGYLALVLCLNLALAHYREAAGSLVSDAGHEVLVRLRETDGCDRPSSRPAREKLPLSAARTKTANSCSRSLI